MTTTKAARTIQVIVVDEEVSEGGKKRIAQHLYTLDGKLICTIDDKPLEKK